MLRKQRLFGDPVPDSHQIAEIRNGRQDRKQDQRDHQTADPLYKVGGYAGKCSRGAVERHFAEKITGRNQDHVDDAAGNYPYIGRNLFSVKVPESQSGQTADHCFDQKGDRNI